MKKDDLTNDGMSENNVEKTLFTKPVQNGLVSYIEREVDRFDFDDYEVVRRELFSKALCPAVTFKYGLVKFNVRAVRKLDECVFIQILINSEKKLMIAKPCAEDDKDSLQWCYRNKDGKITPRDITGKIFTAQLFEELKWDIDGTYKILGTLLQCKNGNKIEKLFVFDLGNAEAYMSVSAPSPDNPKRRERVPLIPMHWQGRYGLSYDENKVPLVGTFEGMPEGFVKITLPPSEAKRSTKGKK